MVPNHPLDGARDRLDRADQSIQNLNTLIGDFLAPAPIVMLDVDIEQGTPIIADKDREMYEKLQKFVNQSVPLRPRVLAGEIIHHLRSAFDHVAWQLSSADLQAKCPTKIEFPVFKDRPKLCGIKKKAISGYCRKVEGITSPSALARIHNLQPHLRDDPSRDPLWLIHYMDIIDKHRELVLAVLIGQVNISANAEIPGIGVMMPWEIKPRAVRHTGPPTKVEMKVKMSAQITFGEFSGRKDPSLIPTLQNFLRFTIDAVESFAEEFA